MISSNNVLFWNYCLFEVLSSQERNGRLQLSSLFNTWGSFFSKEKRAEAASVHNFIVFLFWASYTLSTLLLTLFAKRWRKNFPSRLFLKGLEEKRAEAKK